MEVGEQQELRDPLLGMASEFVKNIDGKYRLNSRRQRSDLSRCSGWKMGGPRNCDLRFTWVQIRDGRASNAPCSIERRSYCCSV